MLCRRLFSTSGSCRSIGRPVEIIRLSTQQSRRSISTSLPLRDEAASKDTKPASPPSKSKPDQPTQQPLSACPEGTVLKGINYIKKNTDPIALADDQYPEWLWTVKDYRRPRLDDAENTLSAQDQAALYGKSKKKRQAALKKMAALGDSGGPRVTLDHQTVDMPYEDAFEAAEHRDLAKKYAKQRRTAAIKERNFLNVI